MGFEGGSAAFVHYAARELATCGRRAQVTGAARLNCRHHTENALTQATCILQESSSVAAQNSLVRLNCPTSKHVSPPDIPPSFVLGGQNYATMYSSMLAALLPCLGIKPTSDATGTCIYENGFNEKTYHDDDPQDIENAAERFVSALLAAKTGDRNGPLLRKHLNESIGACNWSEWLAKRILTTLEKALTAGIKLGAAVKEAAEKAAEAAIGFARDHPVYTTLIALGVLAIMAPEVLAWLGFAELGPVEGSWAALWQARYAGYVLKGSLFSFFQRLGMTWHWI